MSSKEINRITDKEKQTPNVVFKRILTAAASAIAATLLVSSLLVSPKYTCDGPDLEIDYGLLGSVVINSDGETGQMPTHGPGVVLPEGNFMTFGVNADLVNQVSRPTIEVGIKKGDQSPNYSLPYEINYLELTSLNAGYNNQLNGCAEESK